MYSDGLTIVYSILDVSHNFAQLTALLGFGSTDGFTIGMASQW